MNKLYLYILSLFLLISCNDDNVSKFFPGQESYFNEKLSSISADSLGLWIGSETGVVWNIANDRKKRFETGLDRIYDIERDRADKTLVWIATRNTGLQLWRQKGDSLLFQQAFEIPKKGNRYSVYDITAGAGKIFIATSQGLYGLDARGASSGDLKIIYPTKKGSNVANGSPHPINSLFLVKDNLLFAATRNGLLCHHLKNSKTELRHQGEDICSISFSQGKLYVVSGKQLFVESIEGKEEARSVLPVPAVAFHKIGQVYYLFSSTDMLVSENLNHFKRIPLKYPLPSKGHNIVVPDDGKGFSHFATEQALMSVPHHLNAFSGKISLIAACAYMNTFYYVNNKGELFRQDKDARIATKIYDFPNGLLPVEMSATEDQLFFHSSDNALYSVKLQKHYMANELFTKPQKLFQAKTNITAFKPIPSKDIVLIGIQDELMRLELSSGEVDSIKGMENKYITCFYVPKTEDNVYMGTLNDGIFCYMDNKVYNVDGTKDCQFIQDIFTDNNFKRNLFVLTNHQFLSANWDSVKTNGNKKLYYLNDTTVYSLAESGVKVYRLKGNSIIEQATEYSDIRFIPKASFLSDGNLYLGSDLGVAILADGVNGELQWIEFDDNVFGLKYLLLTILFLVLLPFFAYLLNRRRKTAVRRQLCVRIGDLRRRAADTNSVLSQLGPKEIDAMSAINCQLDLLDANDSKIELVNEKIQEISERIMRLNRDAALQMAKVLDRQIVEIRETELYERAMLIKESEKARLSDNVDVILSQTKSNALWLSQARGLKEQTLKLKEAMQGMLIIKGVNDKFCTLLNGIERDWMLQPLSKVYSRFIDARTEYERINSDESAEKIEEFMEESKGKLRNEVQYQHTATLLMAELDIIHKELTVRDRGKLLKTLLMSQCRIKQLDMLHRLSELMKDFIENYEIVVKENEARRMRKFNTKLYEEIELATKSERTEIINLIDALYESFNITDRTVFKDLLHFANANNQQVKVLMLLLADAKVKRVYLSGMLGIYGSLNPVISRLHHGKIEDNREALEHYCIRYPTSNVYYLLKLIE